MLKQILIRLKLVHHLYKSIFFFKVAKSIWNSKCEEINEKDLTTEPAIMTCPSVVDYISDVRMANVMQHGCALTHYTKQLIDSIRR